MSQSTLTVAVAQLNFTVGDLAGNADRIVEAISHARNAGADLLLTPELALSGYPPEDLLLRRDFHLACTRQMERIVRASRDICVVLGHPCEQDGKRFNAATVIENGKIVHYYFKKELPNTAVFDEKRYFSPGFHSGVFEVKGVRLGLAICEDIWTSPVALAAYKEGAQAILVLNASPYSMYRLAQRHQVVRDRTEETRLPILYCNMVGGQDELVFDGASFALDRNGHLSYQTPSFEERIDLVRLEKNGWKGESMAPARQIEAEVYEALKLGVRDYVEKNRFESVLIGLSGGIDSALTLAVAVDALGAERVRAVMMASPFTAPMSLDDARNMAERVGVRYDQIPIEPAMKVFADMLAPQFNGLPEDTTEENLQSRIRGVLLMALSNKTGALVLTTGNKSEMATGYATLYGDMAGGFAVLKDVYKTFVYRLANWRNRISEVIPRNIIDRPPSAELKPGQTDQDSLPPYEVLDGIIEAYMERDESLREIIMRGYPEADVLRTVRLLRHNEYKRRQAPLGIRVTARGFGRDWRYPVTSGFRDEF